MKLGPDMPSTAPPKPRSRVNFNFDKKHGKMMPPGAKVGKKHKMVVSGRVTGLRSDEYGHSLDMDLDSLSHDTDNDQEQEGLVGAGTPVNQAIGGSLTSALKAYHSKRHTKSGKFIA